MPEGMARAGASLSAPSVPDTDSLRRALLAASWQRDRDVGRRRLRQRWAAWAAQRIGLAALAAGALGWGFVSLQPQAVDNTMARLMSFGAPAAGIATTHTPTATATSATPAATVTTDTPSTNATAQAASAATPATEAVARGDEVPQLPRPALRLDLDPQPSATVTPHQP